MKKRPLIGRIEEKKILENALLSNKAEMVAVIGRRRVGKTYLVKSVYQNQIDFEFTGVQHATRNEQLKNFHFQIMESSKESILAVAPKDWMDAFYILAKFLEKKANQKNNSNRKLIVFLDELPWMASHKSGFLKGLSWFWNSWAVNQEIVLVICGSAASWMIKNVVHNKGGLHNRITRRIYLKPFNLFETEQFLKSKNPNIDRYQLLHFYMAFGGVPHYLDEIEPGKSAAQNIDNICFAENGLLWDEFPKLFSSLFDEASNHIKVVRALASKQKGMTRAEIVHLSRIPEGGGVKTVLEELEYSGFISTYLPFGKKKKDSLFRLTDEFSIFYLQFMENNRSQGTGIWQQLSKTQNYISWSGYAFENICLKHLGQIRKFLGISGILSTASTFLKKGTEEQEGVQFDLLIDRNDHAINICEIKFYSAEYTIDKKKAMDYRNKLAAFREETKTKKQLFFTFITTFGLKENQHSVGLVDVSLTMDELFLGS